VIGFYHLRIKKEQKILATGFAVISGYFGKLEIKLVFRGFSQLILLVLLLTW
jgi:hypothetical protein